MIGEIAAMVSGAKQAAELVKGLGALDDQRKINDAIIPVQQLILDMQRSAFEAQERYEELTKENHRLKQALERQDAWEKIEKDYEPLSLAEGLVVYQPACDSGRPAVPACPTCFVDRKLSLLQKPDVNLSKLVCHTCKWECRPTERKHPMIQTVPRTRRNRYDGLY